MKNLSAKKILFLLLVSLFLSGLMLERSYSRSPLGGIEREPFPAGPQLLYPVTEDIKLSGKQSLEFRWNFPNQIDTDYFYLRIYKGFDTTVKNMIFRQRYSVSELPPKLPASFFQLNQVYTWVLVQVYFDGRRSEGVFSPFKITKQ